MRSISYSVLALLSLSANAQQDISRFEIFDRYDPTHMAYEVGDIEGEHLDLRTLGLSYEVEDYVLPGNGGLDIVISRSFNRLSHTPSDMGHWYFGVPRIQIPTSPWRGPYDPSSPLVDTFFAAWNNLHARLGFGADGICEKAGNLVDQYVVASQTRQTKAGILFAAPLMLHIPGAGSKILLEKTADADHFPADARYVTTDNWYARCLSVNSSRAWGGFEVVSPDGLTYTFDFIQYMVPGEYALGTAGGWVELGISRIEDVHGNRIDYEYDTGPGGTDLLARIEGSDGRLVTLDYYPGSVLGVDVQGSPLSLISQVNVHADGEIYPIQYEYCDFADYYILEIGCTSIDLGPDQDLPVLHSVTFPGGERTQYRYNPDLYSVNVLLAWGNFEFLLESVRLPTGGVINYDYASGYHPVLQHTNAPAPRLASRRVSGRDVAPAEWRYRYDFASHIETSTVIAPSGRRDVYKFYEGLGTYEFRIAKYPGQHSWPDTAPTDFDEIMGQLESHSVFIDSDNTPLRTTSYEYALLPFIGRQYYSGNWLGWPTLVLAQIRPMPVSRTDVYDLYTSMDARMYSTYTDVTEFDEYGFPQVVHQQGVDVLAADHARYERLDLEWLHDPVGGFIGLPTRRVSGDYQVQRTYHPGKGLLATMIDGGVRTDYAYDESGNLILESWIRDGISHQKTYSNYHRGQPQMEVFPVDPAAGTTQSVTRLINDLGQTVWSEDALGNRTLYDSDFNGRITSIISPATAPVAIQYDLNSSGELVEVITQQGDRQRVVSVDGFNRATLLKDYADTGSSVAPRAQSWSYDASGRMAFESYPHSWSDSAQADGTAFAYDELDRIVSKTNSATGLSVDYCYSWRCNTDDYFAAAGELFNGHVRTDEEGYQAGFEYVAVGHPKADVLARVIEQIAHDDTLSEPSFRRTAMHIDNNGNMVAVVQGDLNGNSLARQFIYAHPRLIEEHHPETGVTAHEYDERGNRISSAIGGRPPTRFRYDGLNRLEAVDYPGISDDVFYTYDSAGRLLTLENRATRWTYAYDAAGRLISEAIVLPDKTAEFSYAYDQLGNLNTQVYPSGLTVDYNPDGFGRPRRAGDVVLNAEYWPNNAIRAIAYGNGISAAFGQNARQMPRERNYFSSGQALLQGFKYTYDGRGNTLRITDHFSADNSSSMKYDGLSRLASVTDIFGPGGISYDATGNILLNTLGGRELRYKYDAQNRLDYLLASETYRIDVAHDEVGNITATDYFDYYYNPASQLAGVAQLPDLHYAYDGNGRRTITEDSDGRAYSIYNKAGELSYIDSCNKGGQISEFVYLGPELVGRIDSECTQGCHP